MDVPSMLGQFGLSPQDWREFVNLSVPLAMLTLLAIGFWRSVRWLSIRFLEPLGGPDGRIAQYLRTQEEQSREQTATLRLLVDKFNQYSSESQQGIEMLLKMHGDANSVYSTKTVEAIVLDLIRINHLLGRAIEHTIEDPSKEQRVKTLLKQIDRIVHKYSHATKPN